MFDVEFVVNDFGWLIVPIFILFTWATFCVNEQRKKDTHNTLPWLGLCFVFNFVAGIYTLPAYLWGLYKMSREK